MKYLRAILSGLLFLYIGLIFGDDIMSRDMKRDYYLAKIKSDKEKPQLRVTYIDSLNSLNPANISLYLKEKGQVYIKAAKFAKAAEVYSELASQKGLPLNLYLDAVYWAAWSNSALGRYEKALDNIYELIKPEKPDSLDYYDAEADFLLCNLYRLLGNTNMSNRYLSSAARKINGLKCPEIRVNHFRFRWHLEKSGTLLKAGKYDEALMEIKKARKFNMDKVNEELILMDMAELYDHIGEPEIAEEYWLKFISETSCSLHNSANREYAMCNYALFLMRQKRYDESLRLCRSQLTGMDSTGMTHVRGVLYEIMAQNLAALDRHEDAYKSLWESRELLDSVMRMCNQESVAAITYDFENRLAALEYERLQKADKKKLILIIGLCVIGVAISCITVWIWQRGVKRKKRNQLLIREMETKEIEHRVVAAELSEETEVANREIVSISMRMAESDALLSEIASISGNARLGAKEAVSQIRLKLRGLQANERTWEVFQIHFEKTHPHFLAELYRRHPDLTQGEVRMAAFIVMNMSGKEIANLLCRSERTVESTKYRLHKKLGIGPEMTTAVYLRTLLVGIKE